MTPMLAEDSEALVSRQLFEGLPVAAFLLAGTTLENARIERLNRRGRELLGLEPQQLPREIGAFLDRLHADDGPGCAQGWQQAMASGAPMHWQGRFLPPEATSCWLQLEATPVGPELWQGVLIDITALRQGNRTRQASPRESRRLLDSIPVAIAIAQLDGDDPEVTYINEQFVLDFGYRRDQLRRISDWKRLAFPDPDYGRKVFAQWDRAVERARREQGAVEWMEFTVTTAEGRPREVLFSARVQEPELLVTLLDVSERRQAESALNEARRQLAQTALEVTEAIPVGTYTMVLRPGQELASFSFLSERFLQLTGLERQEALEDPLKAFACVHPEDYDDWVRMNSEVFEKKLPFFGETRVVVNGQVRWITAESVPRDLPDGTTVWEGVLIDVTDRIEAKQQLQRSQAHLERILDNIPVAIAINTLDADDPQISFLNDHFIRTLGYSLDDLPRVSDWARQAYPDLIYRQEVFRDWNAAMVRAMAQKGTVEQGEYRVRSKDGRELRMLISAVVLDDMALIALIDVTRSREAERQLLEALVRERDREEELRKGIEEKLRVSLSASAVAHEISQPLSAILLHGSLALRTLEGEHPEPATLRALLEPLVQEARRMDLITERIRMLLRHAETRLVELDLRDVVSTALLQMGRPLAEAGVEFLHGVPDGPWLVRGDPVQLQLALINLLRNGLEALVGARTPQPRMALTLRHAGAAVELVVGDNGLGFPEGFDPEVPLRSTKSDGSGIGLYVVRLTMVNHNGSLHCGRSEQLGGAEVALRLPRAPVAGEVSA